MTLDIAAAADGRARFTIYGLSLEPSASPDCRLGAVCGMAVFALRRLNDGDLEVERDAGHVATFHPAPPAAAPVPGHSRAGPVRTAKLNIN